MSNSSHTWKEAPPEERGSMPRGAAAVMKIWKFDQVQLEVQSHMGKLVLMETIQRVGTVKNEASWHEHQIVTLQYSAHKMLLWFFIEILRTSIFGVSRADLFVIRLGLQCIQLVHQFVQSLLKLLVPLLQLLVFCTKLLHVDTWCLQLINSASESSQNHQ